MGFLAFIINENYSLSKLAKVFGQSTDPETSLDE